MNKAVAESSEWQVLELEEQQSARWWREEEGLLVVKDGEQRARLLQHLFKYAHLWD